MKDNNIYRYLDLKNIKYHKSYSIKKYLTIEIGGIVNCIIFIKKKNDLIDLIKIIIENNENFVIIGGGSNVLFTDPSPELFVIINNSESIELINNYQVKVDSGVSNKELLNWCKYNSICGLEFLAGIPGTIGGAAAVNAGAFGSSMSDIVNEAEVYYLKKGIKNIKPDLFEFKYRDSVFKYGKDIILSLKLDVDKCSEDDVTSKIKEILKKRGTKHPSYKEKTAGCFFKNPIINGEKRSAGELIELSGLRGRQFSNIAVSKRHSNFIINTNNASFIEISNAVNTVITETYAKTDVRLEREVIYILPDGGKK